MLDNLKNRLNKVEKLALKAIKSLNHFYSEQEFLFYAKKEDGMPKPLSHSLCILTSIKTSQYSGFDNEEREKQLNVYFNQIKEWSFQKSTKNKDFNFYVKAVSICAISELLESITDPNYSSANTTYQTELKGELQAFIQAAYKKLVFLSESKEARDYPSSHPMFLYWIRRACHCIQNTTLNNYFNEEKIEGVNKHLKVIAERQLYYYISMCSAIQDNEEDALKLGYLLYTLAIFENFDNDVLLEHGMMLVLNILFSDNKTPKIQPIYRSETLNLHSSPIEILVLLSETRPINNDFNKYIKYYERAFEWINSTKRLQDNSLILWMVEPWRGVDKPEAWLNCLRINFLFLYKNLVKNQLKFEILEKYNSLDEVPKFRFDQLILEPTVKSQINELILSVKDNMINTKKYDKCSLLLYGPPGTAKTSISRAIAYKLGFPLIIISPHHFAENGMDGIIRSARIIFDEISILDNCVVLFDELDELVSKRDQEYEKLSKFITTSMLPWFQDLHDKGDLVFIATTNHIKQFDPAIKRPGRFDYVLPIGPPDDTSLKNLIGLFLNDNKKDLVDTTFASIEQLTLTKPQGQEFEDIQNGEHQNAPDLRWRPTIGEIKLICDMLNKNGCVDDYVDKIVKKIGDNPLINYKNQFNFNSEKGQFRHPPE